MSELGILKDIGVQGLSEALYEHSMVSVTSKSGEILYVNASFCEVSNYTEAELIGKPHRIVRSDFHSPIFFKTLWETILRGEVWKGEIKNRCRNGQNYWVQCTIIPLRDKKGEIQQFLSLQTDITAHKQKAELYAVEKKFFQDVAEITKSGGWAYFPKTEELTWTPETYLLHECNSEEKIDLKSAFEFYLPEARPVIQWAVERALREGEGWDLELPIKTRRGNFLWAHVIGKVEWRNGEIFRLYGLFQDISEQKEAMDALKSSQERMRLYLKHTPAAIAMFDREMRYLAWSDRWVKDYRIGNRDIEGVSHYDVFPELPERWKEDHRRVLSGEVYINEDDHFVRED
ncbi:MAG: PAS domain-containing protein, partial [Verrucomicrobiota bacterium]